jgi:hypothetical protein
MINRVITFHRNSLQSPTYRLLKPESDRQEHIGNIPGLERMEMIGVFAKELKDAGPLMQIRAIKKTSTSSTMREWPLLLMVHDSIPRTAWVAHCCAAALIAEPPQRIVVV